MSGTEAWWTEDLRAHLAALLRDGPDDPEYRRALETLDGRFCRGGLWLIEDLAALLRALAGVRHSAGYHAGLAAFALAIGLRPARGNGGNGGRRRALPTANN